MKIGSREKVYIIVIIILLAVLSVKSLYFDEISNLSEREQIAVQNIYQTLDEKYNGFLYDSGLLSYRVVKLKLVEEEGKEFYRCKARKYILHVLPFQETIIDFEEGSTDKK